METDTAWQIVDDADDDAAYAALAADRAWTGYAIGDLDPPFRAFSRYALARRKVGPVTAACLVLRHPDFAAIVPHGDPDGLSAILDRIELPERTFISTRAEHLPALRRHYRLLDGFHEMRRMHLTAQTFTPPASPQPVVERLGPQDLPALLDLYTGYAESAFVPDHLASGVFHGVWEGEKLVAAAGTQVLSRRHGIAAVGNIFTRPEARGHGFATATTAATAAALLSLPCADVILNVAVTNTGAAAIYSRLGFRDHCRFWEGTGER